MFEKVFRIITNVITITLLILGGVFIGLKFTGHTPFVVQSGSMEPVIHTGAVAFINTHDKDVEAGDIITYQMAQDTTVEIGDGETATAHGGQTVTHRVISVEGDNLYTKGDANDNADFVPVPKSQVIGTYMFQVPKIGFFMAKADKKIWFIYGGIIIVLNVAAALISDFSKEDETKTDNTTESKAESEEPNKNADNNTTEETKQENTENAQSEVQDTEKESEEARKKEDTEENPNEPEVV